MTNEEKARTLSLQDHLTNDDYALCPSNDTIVRINAYGAAMEMAEWKEQQMIEKAVDWLKERAEHYYGVEGEYSDKVDLIFCKEEPLEDFKEAMMED